jgi:threonine aldolase
MIIDLRSDTVTRPTKPMLEAMFNAKVGDDVFGEDPSINELESKAAKIFGMEAGVFCPSGTMTNQIAVKTHTNPMEEVIIERTNHVYFYEVGGIAFHSLCSIRTIDGDHGRIKPSQIEANINSPNLHHTITSLVCIENTSNRGGGAYYTLDEMIAISNTCRKHKLKLHLDGARIFNAIVELNINPAELGKHFDSISVCLSKGLGCPVGSVLLGSKEFIGRARKFRKSFGGGMRQAGFLAAAGIYALDNHVQRLKDDHLRAKQIGDALKKLPSVDPDFSVYTNIIIFKLKPGNSADDFVKKLDNENIKCFSIGDNKVRMLTHLDFNDEQLVKMLGVLNKM